ncbi:MAG: hypothetical protein HC905_24835 [Bacteroidales bacterium]|nr:hypothetical protein [Bacteroidales bacterium]
MKTLTIIACTIFLFSSCEKKKEETSSKVKAIGTFLTKVEIDKSKVGDFIYVLELEKPEFSINDSLLVENYFYNIGNKTINLLGFFPDRSAIGRPRVVIILNDSTDFIIEGLLPELQNENDIVIEPNEKVTFMRFDLLEVEGIILKKMY